MRESDTSGSMVQSDGSWDVVSASSTHEPQSSTHMTLSVPGRGEYMKDKPVRTFAAHGSISPLSGHAPVAALMCLLSLLGAFLLFP